MVDSPGPDDVVAGLLDALDRSGCDALNLRVHVPGVAPEAAREQIARLGDEVARPAPGRPGRSAPTNLTEASISGGAPLMSDR